MMPYVPPRPSYADPVFAYAFARLVTHFWSRDHFIEEGAVLRDAHRLADIPTVFVQGGIDLGNLVGTPWLLARAMPHAELIMIDDEGHSSSQPGMRDALISATDRFGK
jgi:proline iminopeptidase